ncbi:MAG: heme o synthase [Pyrinomonadaceae bacterium MAG19_C2-C3]|nr:heme o synthase [Pyrinomonadaceae bacterium MAG19_C2-C3]
MNTVLSASEEIITARTAPVTTPIVMSARTKINAYVELTKPRIALMIVLIAAAGFALGSRDGIDFSRLFHALFGIALLSGGIAALNQYLERERDCFMPRTASRPLPSNRLTPFAASMFGVSLTVSGIIYLAFFVNPLTALLGTATAIGYVLIYTPLKTRTSLSTVIGAFPGAVPPLIGWAAATGRVPLIAWALFAIQFLWQFPHFLAIAWMYKDEYEQAEIRMLPVVERQGVATAQQSIIYALLLIPVSLLPTLLGLTGMIYFYGALALGLFYLWASVRTGFDSSRTQARRLLLASVIYLPLLFALMVFDTTR